ncbi:MAG: peptide ABC transporter substrate-binding protein [Verrucomicrobia bacterium]|nr:peptide ABC transporter substrate-binding protein [Verrucomicrobiota bacterium]
MIQLMLVTLFFMGLTGCNSSGEKKVYKQELRACLPSDPVSMDPRTGVDSTSEGVLRMLYSGLVYIDKNDKTTLALAESYDVSEDFRVYTFHLKKTYWSDGSPLTARDFEESWKGMLFAKFTSFNSNLVHLIKNAKAAMLEKVPADAVGVKALDDLTLRIELEKPHTTFIDVLTNSIFYPVHSSIRKESPDFSNYIGCGPFKLKKYAFNNTIVVEKNPHYWDAEVVKLDSIKFYIIKDAVTALLMFKKGELDWLGSGYGAISLDATPELQKSGQLHTLPAAGTGWLAFNVKNLPFNNIHIRKAFGYAMNRKDIISNVLQNQYAPALGLIPKIQKKERWHPFMQDCDKALARQMFEQGLQELGFTRESFPTITLTYHDAEFMHKLMQAVQQQWSEILGVKIELARYDWATFLEHLHNRDFDVTMIGWRVQYDDPANILDLYKDFDSPNNSSNWENAEFRRDLELAFSSPQEKRWEYLEAAENIILTEMPIVPFFYFNTLYLKNDHVQDAFVSKLRIVDFRWASIQ